MTASRTPMRWAWWSTITAGVAQVAHSGSTAGYRAHLTRFPTERLSVAVLCNVSSGAATQYAMSIAEMYLDGKLQPVDDEAGRDAPGRRRRQPASTPKAGSGSTRRPLLQR